VSIGGLLISSTIRSGYFSLLSFVSNKLPTIQGVRFPVAAIKPTMIVRYGNGEQVGVSAWAHFTIEIDINMML